MLNMEIKKANMASNSNDAKADVQRPSLTVLEQTAVEVRVKQLLDDFQLLSGRDASPRLLRDDHVVFLMAALRSLGAEYTTLDASRPWLVYWIVHSLSLLGIASQFTDSVKDAIASFLQHCEAPSGGFGGGPGQAPHLATTYAAVCALSIVNRASIIHRAKLYSFLLRMKVAEGGFRMHDDGEVDVRGTYTAMCVASLLSLLTPELTVGVGEWIASCQTYEGGFGGEPGNEAHGGYTFCALALIDAAGQSQAD